VVAAGCAALASPAAAAEAAKTLRVVFAIAETSFDPQFASDAASDSVTSNIYEQMLDYDYLARISFTPDNAFLSASCPS
jgi:ABC-type transport system substrate-binding protein